MQTVFHRGFELSRSGSQSESWSWSRSRSGFWSRSHSWSPSWSCSWSRSRSWLCSRARLLRSQERILEFTPQPQLLTFRQLQAEQRPWVAHNFPGRPAHFPLLGAVEELGELAHAHLKREQKIRGTDEEHHAKAKDAIGDVVIFLSDYCEAMGYDFQTVIEETWVRVKQRDWQRDRVNGGENG